MEEDKKKASAGTEAWLSNLGTTEVKQSKDKITLQVHKKN